MHVLLHIGTHKTGTTSIQDALRASSDALLREGILFPEAGSPRGLSGQHMLAWAVRADKQHKMPSPPPPVWDELQEEIQAVQPRKVILSAEAFEKATRAEVKAVREKLDGLEVSVVLYLRSPIAYLKSAYKQQVKTGKCCTSLSRFMKERREGVDYESLIERWVDVFGAANVHVRVFEDAVERGLLSDFAQVAGIDEEMLDEEARSNVSPPDEIIRIVRYLNLVERKLGLLVQSDAGRRGFIERVRRRVLRGGPVARMLEAASRMISFRFFYRAK